MTRYNESADNRAFAEPDEQLEGDGYREGVERVIWYLDHVKRVPRITQELRTAIQGGVI